MEENKKEALLKKKEEAADKAKKLNLAIEKQNRALERASKKKKSLESASFEVRWELRRIHELLIVDEGFSKECVRLRGDVISKIKLSQSKDITVGEKESLEIGIATLNEMLTAICPHNFLLSYDGYSGSYSNDYDDARYGVRRCVICTFHERSESTKNDIYDVLRDRDDRIVKRDLRHLDRSAMEADIWDDLEVFKRMFERSAGKMNAEWHDKKNT